ncbi:MAG: hypothetical protein ACRDD1_09330 [Planctomycetia bacterium]
MTSNEPPIEVEIPGRINDTRAAVGFALGAGLFLFGGVACLSIGVWYALGPWFGAAVALLGAPPAFVLLTILLTIFRTANAVRMMGQAMSDRSRAGAFGRGPNFAAGGVSSVSTFTTVQVEQTGSSDGLLGALAARRDADDLFGYLEKLEQALQTVDDERRRELGREAASWLTRSTQKALLAGRAREVLPALEQAVELLGDLPEMKHLVEVLPTVRQSAELLRSVEEEADDDDPPPDRGPHGHDGLFNGEARSPL